MSTKRAVPSVPVRSIDPKIRQRRQSIQRSQGLRRLRRLVAALIVVGVAVVVLVALHTPLFSARVIRITGSHPRTPAAAIVAASELGRHPSLIDVDPGAVAARVEALPFIETAAVTRHWPDGVSIHVTERTPAAQMAGPGRSWSVIDADGRTLEAVPAPVPGLRTLAIDTSRGAIQPPAVGASLTPAAGSAVTVVRTLPLAFAGQVTAVTEHADGTLELTLGSGIHVDMGSSVLLHAKYEDVAAIIAHGKLDATSVIDVTIPNSPTVGG